MVSQATVQPGNEAWPGIEAKAHSLGQHVMFRLAEVARNHGRPASPGRFSHQATLAQGPNRGPASRNRPGRVSCPQAAEPVGKSWMPRSSDTTARPVSDGNLSTAGHHKMDITKLRKPLRRLTLGFAIISAIVPVIMGATYLWEGLFGYGFSIGREFVVFVGLCIISAFCVFAYVLLEKTRIVGIVLSLVVCTIGGLYLLYRTLVPLVFYFIYQITAN